MRRAAAALAALTVLAGCGGSGGGGKTGTGSGPAVTQTTRVEVVRPRGSGSGFDPQTIYKTESPGVVTLVAFSGAGQNLGGQASEALGSGFVVDALGDIATNAHVVTSDSGRPANQVYVEFADGNRLAAKLVGTDPDSDVAVVKVDPAQLRGPSAKLVPLPLGSTANLQVGDPVAAIGSPFGEQQSLSVGVVSALNRDIQSLTRFDIPNAIQTDAAINHGNSGGPLLDGTGRVVGINSQISSTSGGGEGVGFAIPVELVKHSVDQLRTKGSVAYAYIGIRSVSLYPQLAERLGLKPISGVLLDSIVPGGPAAKAGLRGAAAHVSFQGATDIPAGGDVITAIDGHKLSTAEDLSAVIELHEPGDVVHLQVVRGGKQVTVAVKLGKRPEQRAGAH